MCASEDEASTAALGLDFRQIKSHAFGRCLLQSLWKFPALECVCAEFK